MEAINCLPQCHGVYADVHKKKNFDIVKKMKNIKKIGKIYENYKQGVQYEFDYAKLGSGKNKISFQISGSKCLFRI